MRSAGETNQLACLIGMEVVFSPCSVLQVALGLVQRRNCNSQLPRKLLGFVVTKALGDIAWD